MADLALEACEAAWRRMIEFPMAQVCKHYAALMLGEELEKRGFSMNPEVVSAIVEARDEDALSAGNLVSS